MSHHETPRPSSPLRTVSALVFCGLLLPACGGGGGDGTGNVAPNGNAELVQTQYGRLVDVYGLRRVGSGLTFDLFQEDVLVGPNIQDEREAGSNLRDDEILYDFISSNPDNLQPRLFIPRDMSSQEFQDAFAALDDQLRQVTPNAFGQSGQGSFSVVPRNAALRMTFSRNLGIDDSFFVERNASGTVTGLRNTEAVQLLEIVGDPQQPGGLQVLPTRIVVRNNVLILDPVLLGNEGQQYQTRNNAAGLPESPNQSGANIRIAIALEGPLSIPGVREDSSGGLTGVNNSGRRAVIRDFRSGNRNDNSANISRGFIRDPIPPRVVGEIVMFLERVDQVNQFVQEITIFKNGIIHEIDRGDAVKFVIDNSGEVVADTEVVVDPDDDRGNPGVQHVRVRVRNVPELESFDPSNNPNFPVDPTQREEWLVQNAPRAILVAEFRAGGASNPGDDPRYFITFAPKPLPDAQGNPSEPNENVSPRAGAVIRFTKPVDLATVKALDTFFFATRNLVDEDEIENFRLSAPNGSGTPGIEPASFSVDKFWTPHLIFSRRFDEDGSQTALRLQPTLGFYLDDTMRNAQPQDFRYYMHIIGGSEGIRDLSGNAVDFQAEGAAESDRLVIPFSLDIRRNTNGRPVFEDNLVVSIARRFEDLDEDEQPSYYMPSEVQPPGAATPRAEAFSLDDLFGAFVFLDGQIQARPTTRVTQVADNLNQAPVASQATPLRWCPERVAGEEQVAANTSTTPFGQGIQNPLNPFGCRLQTVWREIDMSLSRVDPRDFNLDIEQMYWAPFTGATIQFDEFDRVSLFLGHSEFRPEPCVGNFSALPTLPQSGLKSNFAGNFVNNPEANATTIETRPDPHPAYVDAVMTIDPNQAILEPNRVNRFMPLPEFQEPFFVWRDEQTIEQGGISSVGADVSNGLNNYAPYIISPWLNGTGRRVVSTGQNLAFRDNFWMNSSNYNLAQNRAVDRFTGGLVGTVALPLLSDFWTYCDSPNLPMGNGFIAQGTNGWQISITVQSNFLPAFRAYSAGRPPGISPQPPLCRGPGDPAWNQAAGGFGVGGAPTRPLDNSFYWIMMDLLKRTTVVTNGFVDILNPHRVPQGHPDPRLGPFFLQGGLPQDVLPTFVHDFEPPLEQLPGGTAVVAQFRGASEVDSSPWFWNEWFGNNPALQPDEQNFPLDPFKAGDAHIRKFDDRPVPGTGTARNSWTYFYNRTVTSYVENLNTLMDASFTNEFSGPNEGFTPRDVRYFNWRFIMTNNVEADPPVSPTLDTFAVTYRFERTR